MSLFLLFSVLLFLTLSYYSIEGVKEVLQEHQTFQPPIVEEYECVDIYRQPAFNNILLKNHKIQMNPSVLPKTKRNNKLLFSSRIPGKGCPMGMVPIQRYQVDNLTNLNSISRLHLGNFQSLTSAAPGLHFGAASIRANYIDHGDPMHGAMADIGLHNPPVKMYQISSAQIWVENGPPGETNSIQVGWQVNPRLYGDNLTRATAFWTADAAQKTGCYNTICPGFVQVHPQYHLGLAYGAISVIGGQQYVTRILVFKDKTSGNWWLVVNDDVKIGYWPKELFTHLNEGTTFIQYGGWTFNSPDGLSPPMGNGHFPDDRFKFSSYFVNMRYVDTSDIAVHTPASTDFVIDNPGCYNVKGFDRQGPVMGQCITYGGPGGNCGT